MRKVTMYSINDSMMPKDNLLEGPQTPEVFSRVLTISRQDGKIIEAEMSFHSIYKFDLKNDKLARDVDKLVSVAEPTGALIEYEDEER